MKAIAHRPKDLEDIRTIIDKNSGLDIDLFRQRVLPFADILETQTLWADIAELFKQFGKITL